MSECSHSRHYCILTHDLSIQFAVQGLSPKIPRDKIFLVLSEDGLEWKEKKNGIDTAVGNLRMKNKTNYRCHTENKIYANTAAN